MAKAKHPAGGKRIKRIYIRKGGGAFAKRSEKRTGKRVIVRSKGGVFSGQSRGNASSHSRVRNADFMVAQRYLSRDGLVDVDAVAEQFGVTKVMLAQIIGMADETLQRFSRAAAPKTQQRLRDMLEIIGRVEPWAGGMPQALGWYRGQGIPALGDQTAEALVKTDRAKAVRDYLDAFAAGAYA